MKIRTRKRFIQRAPNGEHGPLAGYQKVHRVIVVHSRSTNKLEQVANTKT